MAMNQLTVNYDVYEDNVRYDGTASAQLPDINYIVQSIAGAGIAGNLEAVTPHLDNMTATLNWRDVTDEAYNLNTPTLHTITLRQARQDEDAEDNELDIVPIKHVLVCIPKGLTGAQLAPHASSNPSQTFAVRYFATYIDGVKETELDVRNYICYVHGKDYLANVRAALGRDVK